MQTKPCGSFYKIGQGTYARNSLSKRMSNLKKLLNCPLPCLPSCCSFPLCCLFCVAWRRIDGKFAFPIATRRAFAFLTPSRTRNSLEDTRKIATLASAVFFFGQRVLVEFGDVAVAINMICLNTASQILTCRNNIYPQQPMMCIP